MQSINTTLKEELIKAERIESFLNSTYPDVSLATRYLYKTKIRKYMSGNSKADQKRLELLLRQNTKAITMYRKLFNQFLIYCKSKEQEVVEDRVVNNKTQGESVMESANNQLPINDQLRKIPGYKKLLCVFEKDTRVGMTKKKIVKVFYPLIHNRHTYLSYFYTYLKGLGLWDGKNTYYIKLVDGYSTKNTSVIEPEKVEEVENTNIVKRSNGDSSMNLDAIIDGIKALGLSNSNSESILNILNAEKQKRELEAQRNIIVEETEKYILALKKRGIDEEVVEQIKDSIPVLF